MPNHKIDLNKPLKDQPWLGGHSIPAAVPCITKALCILDVFFGFDGNDKAAPVSMISPFVIPEELLSFTNEIRPARPGTAIPRSKTGKLESTLQESILFTDNYYSLSHRWRVLAYMGLPMDAVEVEDFDYEELSFKIK